MSRASRSADSDATAPGSWLVLALLLLVVAIGYSTYPLPRSTFRYLFVFDITQSMNVGDVPRSASRLEFAKSAVAAALKALPCGSEAGLAVFTEHRTFVLNSPVEICEHYQALIEMIDEVDWRMAWAARSEVAKGLYSAIDAAQQIGSQTHLVFLTDGHEAPPIHQDLQPRFSAQPGSVAGMIAGVGGPVPAEIPRLDDNGNVVGHWRQDEVMQIDLHSLGRPGSERGEPMVGIDMVSIARRVALGSEHLSSLREGYLRELATRTGLDYLRIESAPQFSASLRDDAYARRTPAATDLSRIPAGLALVCLAYCFVVLPLRRRRA